MRTSKKNTKKAWGVVACIGAMVACTCIGNMLVTGISVATFALGAYLGGYMDEALGTAKTKQLNSQEAEKGAAA